MPHSSAMAVLAPTPGPVAGVTPARPFDGVRIVGVVLALGAIMLSIATHQASSDGVAQWQVALALIALAAGIPHGAVDHLLIRRPGTLMAWARYAAAYASAAGAATAFILAMPRVGFLIVIAMTVIHFGLGDAAFSASAPGAVTLDRARRILRIVAGGAVPILIPLTGPGSTAALASLRPELVDWLSPGTATTVRLVTALLAVLTVVVLLDAGDTEGATEMSVLLALALLVPPFVAFAVYFAGWHALRHTARLAQLRDDEGRTLDRSARRLARVALAGMPALLGLAVLVVVLWPRLSGDSTLGGLLWVSLAAVWGLTVPHMALVARLDRRDLA